MAGNPGESASSLSGDGARLDAVDLSLQQQADPSQQYGGDDEKMMQPEVPPIEGTEVRDTRSRTSSRGTQLKEWGTHQLKVTKQVVSEKLGRGTKTVDPDLDSRIDSLRETQRKYSHMISLATQFETHFLAVVETQKSMAEHFAYMSVRNTELHTEFHYNSEAQKHLARCGEKLIVAVETFATNLQTVSSKTMEDTLMTVRNYESARLNYDAYRTDLEKLKQQANASQAAVTRLSITTGEFEKYKQKFEQLRHDVDIKLKLLDQNKVGVWVCVLVGVLCGGWDMWGVWGGWTCGDMGVWGCGCGGGWTCGDMGVWGVGRVGVWVWGWVDVWGYGCVGGGTCGGVGVGVGGRLGIWVCGRWDM